MNAPQKNVPATEWGKNLLIKGIFFRKNSGNIFPKVVFVAPRTKNVGNVENGMKIAPRKVQAFCCFSINFLYFLMLFGNFCILVLFPCVRVISVMNVRL